MSSDTEKFYRIVAELDRRLILGTGDGFWSVRPLFTEMDRSFLNGWSTCRLRELLDDKEVLVFRDRNALTINITKGYAISLALIDMPSGALFLYPQHYMARNVGTVPLKVRRYTPDRPVQNDVYDPAVRLELRDERMLDPGESLERNGHSDVLDWESVSGMGYLLRLHSESLGNYEWSFDRETLAPKGVTVLDSFSSQMTTIMQMLTTLGAPVDPVFVEMGLTSEYFHVRWETLKMIGQIAPERTRETVERLSADPHPAIRRAAERTLQMNADDASAGS
ncbi:MAG TPA: HEAT repeat domain-containing protein [Rhizomicrobium sp.]|jgi:hypothetical protein|nr:HEAT repeat domain-containing protein [Rhizomicrobium sp.]